ncbi:MAG: response regulator [Piscinibacter sp.]|uniref:hybrid sensor histidine kinase/response regulator n=1 Tax=Piscinibacter sp. TaxID=1903157 RepID=UPI003D0FF1DB
MKVGSMMVGIKQKIVLVLVVVLVLSTTVNALVASYFTNRQNEDAAFASLDNHLQVWQSDWHDMSEHLKTVAVSTVGDVAILDQLGELLRLGFNAVDPAGIAEREETRRTLGYRKTVSINRLQLAMRTGGFSSIYVYMGGQLSHAISPSSAGLSIPREDGKPTWIAVSPDAWGNFPLRSWPAWQEAPPPAQAIRPLAERRSTDVSILTAPSGDLVVEVSVPVEGLVQDLMTDDARSFTARFYSELSVVGEPVPSATTRPPVAAGDGKRSMLVEVIFRKVIDTEMLEAIARETGKLPAVLSASDGTARLMNAQFPIGPVRQAAGCGTGGSSRCIVEAGGKSYYVAFVPWPTADRAPLALGLASMRDGTLANIRQTVLAILLVACGTLLVSVVLGLLWVKRLTDPIVNLTRAVKGITTGNRDGAGSRLRPIGNLQPVEITATDEVGKLAAAFNDMVGQLQTSFETLEERVRLRTAELERAQMSAEAATRAKSEFLANMSHEIRTPMNAILGMSRLALQSGLNPQQQNYVQKVHASAELLLGIINDILDFSKIEAGKLDMESIPFNLGDVMDNLGNVIGMRADEKGLELLFVEPPELAMALVGDPSRLSQVLLNLGNNAVKFTERGEVVVAIEMIERRDDSVLLRFEVRDTGIGISAEQQQRLFQPFSQADASTSRRYGGTGLGLAISRQLVHLMGGELAVDSQPGQGSRFHFSVRFGVQPALAAPPRAQGRERLAGVRALIVDDNAAAREVLAGMCGALGLKADTAVDGLEALRMVDLADERDVPYELVLLDWKMPTLDGIECADRISRRIQGRHPTPTVLMLTAFSRDEVQQRLAERRVHTAALLTKPVTPSALLDACSTALGRPIQLATRTGLREETLLGHQANLAGARLLLVEDNAINQELAVELLSRAGVKVSVAGDGREALDQLDRHPFDGVLMDCQMPVMDGYAATRALRERPQFRDLPVIAMTANTMVGDREKVLAAGMNDHIAKPINIEELFATLARWVRPGAAPRAANAASSSAEDPPFSGLHGIDSRAGLDGALGDAALYRKLLFMFRDRERDFGARLRAALVAGGGAAERHAHDLKCTAGTLGAHEVRQAAEALERACREGAGREEIEALVERVTAVLDPVIAGLQAIRPAPPAG